ncbi:peptidoglycan-binding protein [Microbispora sp. RL4-1S]|uniref:Peptidoglycan-binding protein n=1 Tax=Microbispora oryzae TaxID=2806554 RepID=A0A940WJ75_9ACTN|nr:peptidoglycan-binding protein [Microbispora oryzae]MBP2706516.1 peptidoglycan-binding protein [Microbispora oryzae]
MKITKITKTSPVAGAVLVALLAAGCAASPQPTSAPQVAVTSAPMRRTDVVSTIQLPGVLGFDRTYSVVSELPPGVVTAVPRPGAVLGRGARLFAVGGIPAALLYGSVPAHRDFALGMSDGRDVRRLEANLRALGMDPGHAMTVDDHFSTATAAAVRRWQRKQGRPQTGRLDLGAVVFLPGRVRIRTIVTEAGASAGPGTRMLVVNSATRVVQMSLTTDRLGQVRPGDRVEITLPSGGSTVRGRVSRVGRVATAQDSGPATVPVTITLIRPGRAVAGLDLAPVQVAVVTARHENVLTVPVTALLPRPGGGYQVAVTAPGPRRLVPVQPGLFDEDGGTVEITGEITGDATDGAQVEVPLS